MKRLLFLTVLCMDIAMFLASPVCAAVTGNCVNCHTMHNSQDDDHMILNTDIDGTSGGTHGGGYPSLTRGSCVGCHTGANIAGGIYPFVYNTSEPTYEIDTLAGGNFFWAVSDDAKGHNVGGISGMNADAVLTSAPGGTNGGTCANSCHITLVEPELDGNKINTGCEGCHLAPKHHAPQQIATSPALEANGYFRFLSSGEGDTQMVAGSMGVEGIEDPDWGFTNSATDHNEYLGKAGTHTGSETGGFASIGENTMTAYCTGCHGDFHTQIDANANWIRHPSDAILPTTGEYTQYLTYDPKVPLARPDLMIISDPAEVENSDMVMCLSCHRAHGSPYDDMLRWNYDGMVAGGGGSYSGTGCFVCHADKD